MSIVIKPRNFVPMKLNDFTVILMQFHVLGCTYYDDTCKLGGETFLTATVKEFHELNTYFSILATVT